jgi:hypothetical protein
VAGSRAIISRFNTVDTWDEGDADADTPRYVSSGHPAVRVGQHERVLALAPLPPSTSSFNTVGARVKGLPVPGPPVVQAAGNWCARVDHHEVVAAAVPQLTFHWQQYPEP